MASIKIFDLDSQSFISDLINDESSNITGGGFGALGGTVAGAGGSILDNVFHGKPIDWRSAGAWGLAGAGGGAIAGSIGGLAGAALAGED